MLYISTSVLIIEGENFTQSRSQIPIQQVYEGGGRRTEAGGHEGNNEEKMNNKRLSFPLHSRPACQL